MRRRKFIKIGLNAAAASVLIGGKFTRGADITTAGGSKSSTALPDYPFFNPDLPIETRIADLSSRLTLTEKISQMDYHTPAIPRLGIPKYSLGDNGLHGLCRPGKNTVFPQAIAQGATFNPGLINNMAVAVSDEARAHWNVDRLNIQYNSGTLMLWSPVVNMARDPRWGRTQETYGEDAYLTSRIGVACVKGMQGDDPRYLKTVATLKHFAGYNVEHKRFAFNTVASNRYWFEYDFVPYRACIMEAKAQSIMAAYNAINGVPCCCNKWLLTDVLRGRWKFEGSVVADDSGINYIYKAHHYVKTPMEACAAALNAGIDMDTGNHPLFKFYLPDAIDKKLVSMETVDRAFSYLFQDRFRLGMFDPPERVPWSKIPMSVVGCPEHVALARRIACESMVLMQNNPVENGTPLLPVNISKVRRITVIGKSAGGWEYGDYSGHAPFKPVSFIAAIKNRIDKSENKPEFKAMRLISKSKKVTINDQEAAYIKSADVVIVCLTSPHAWEGHDQTELELDPAQEEMIQRVAAINPRIIAVLHTGTAVAIPWIKEHVPAIINAWYPGEEGGPALADVVFGDYNPAGRLPLTYYTATSDLPPMDEYDLYKGNGRTYMYYKGKVLYPFGHGLSYTTFKYTNLRLSAQSFNADDQSAPQVLTVQVDVTNTGDRDGQEVVQAYIHQVQSAFPQPIKQLKAFSRVAIAKGQTQTVTLAMPVSDWTLWDESKNDLRVYPGDYDILLGASSADIRLKASVQVKA